MPFVRSRRNGLKIAIPNDARNIVHRFAVSGGGNEFVFEPISRRDYQASAATEAHPVTMGAPDNEPVAPERVELSVNLADDDDEPAEAEASKEEPKAAPRRRTVPAKPEGDLDIL